MSHEGKDMTYWKVLNGTITTVSGTGYRYPGKGRWTKHLDPGRLEHYSYGYHVAEDSALLNHIEDGPTLWTADLCPDHEPLRVGGKVITCRVRLRERHELSDAQWRLFVADCAEHVLPLFEGQYPDDDRPRKAIEAARAFARGEIGKAELAAAESAARHTARAAYAAGSAARYAARYAAWYAAWSTRDAERGWQNRRLLNYLEGTI